MSPFVKDTYQRRHLEILEIFVLTCIRSCLGVAAIKLCHITDSTELIGSTHSL